jgi:hypothetical protein
MLLALNAHRQRSKHDAPVSANDLEQELRRLHYRPGDPSTGTGIYRRRNDSFDLRARRVRFIEELREPTSVSIRAGSGSITDLRQADGTELPVFRLDPPVVGSVFPVHGEDRLVLSPAEVPPLLRAGIKALNDSEAAAILLAGLILLFNSFLMMRLPDPAPSAHSGMALG